MGDGTGTIQQRRRERRRTAPAGVLVGVLIGLGPDGTPWVSYPGAAGEGAAAARATVRLRRSDIGRRVALLFEGADTAAPIVIGCMLPSAADGGRGDVEAEVDGEAVELVAHQSLVLRCGKASIALKADGSIEIRGTELSSRASGQNRIRGAAIHLN